MDVVDEERKIYYRLDDRLQERLDRIIDRVTRKKRKQDAWIENHGQTGSGKTNTSLIQAHYISMKTGKTIHLFFKTSSVLAFAKRTSEKLIILDEPAFESLSTDQMRTLNRDFLRLINTARKKRHVVIINFTKFWRFPVDIVVDTCLFMIHMKVDDPGKYLYIPRHKLEDLWNDYKKSGKRSFGKYKSFYGRLPEIMEEFFDKLDLTIEGHPHCTMQDYERLKDEAIRDIGGQEKKIHKDTVKLQEWRYKLASSRILKDDVLANVLGVHVRRIQEWRKNPPQTITFTRENDIFAAASRQSIDTRSRNQKKTDKARRKATNNRKN